MTLSKATVRTICDAIRDAKETEVCGFLAGNMTEDQVYVEYARPVRNVYDSNSVFAICQEDYSAALADLKSRCAIVGVYHSHYLAAHLSRRDRSNIVLHPFFWLIVATSPHSFNLKWKCFRPRREAITRVLVEFDDGPSGSQ